MQLVKDFPSGILARLAVVVVGDGGHFDDLGVAVDLQLQGVVSSQDIDSCRQAVWCGIQRGREVALEVRIAVMVFRDRWERGR